VSELIPVTNADAARHIFEMLREMIGKPCDQFHRMMFARRLCKYAESHVLIDDCPVAEPVPPADVQF
jgi:hypothetical protein